MLSSLWAGVAGYHNAFSSCKSVSTKATRSPPSLNSLNGLQFMSRKRIDFPSSLLLCVRGRCFDSVLDQMELPGHARGSATFSPDIVRAPLAPGTTWVLLTVSAGYTRILLPLPHGMFLKLLAYAPGQRFFCRHHWSACSSVVPTLLSASFHLVCGSAPPPPPPPGTQYPARCILSSHAASVHVLF